VQPGCTDCCVTLFFLQHAKNKNQPEVAAVSPPQHGQKISCVIAEKWQCIWDLACPETRDMDAEFAAGLFLYFYISARCKNNN